MSRGSAVPPRAGRPRNERHGSTADTHGRSRPALWSRDGVLPLPGTTYLDHVAGLLPPDGRGPVPDNGAPYPDDEPESPGAVRWAPAAFEGVMSLRGAIATGPEPALAAAAFVQACRRPLATTAVHTVAERLSALTGPSDVDRLLDDLQVDSVVGRLRLAELARWLCRFGTRLRQVQVGLALLARVGGPQDARLVWRLGLLGTLTMRSVEALREILPDPEPALFDLAKQTDGWGRIHAVHGLRGTTTPAVHDWLLRGGYDSGLIDGELAGIAAISGDLAGALQGEVDAELLHHAGRLLVALRWGGPAESLADYPEGGIAIELYLHHAAQADPTLEILGVVQILDDYLRGGAEGNRHLNDLDCLRLSRLSSRVLGDPGWRTVAETALASPNIEEFCDAIRPASRLGVEVRPLVLRRLEHDPAEPSIWYALLDDVSDAQTAEAVAHAERVLDFRGCATGPSLDLMPQDPVSHCLDIVLGHLDDHAGLGWPLVAAGLEHPAVRVRRTALRALEAWPADARPAEAQALLERLRWAEPDSKARGMLVALSERGGASPGSASDGVPTAR